MKKWQRKPWWTRERVVAALARFYRQFGVAVTSQYEWETLTRGLPKGPGGLYPSSGAIYTHFRSFRQAWDAVGVPVDRLHEDWTETEDWYLREAAGIISRDEIARDLRRTPGAVHRRLYDLGLHSYKLHGWSLSRIGQVAGFPSWRLWKYVKRGLVRVRRGSKCCYVDPADLLVVREIDWQKPPPELEAAARHSLLGQLVAILRTKEVIARLADNHLGLAGPPRPFR